MSLPRFFGRVADAALPFLGAVDRDALAARLDTIGVRLRADGRIADDAALSAGFIFAANLLARLYPTVIIDAPEPIAAQARAIMTAINPQIDLEGPVSHMLAFGQEVPTELGVCVAASGWNVVIDGAIHGEIVAAAPAAGLAAAAVGVGEIFRMVFGDLLARGRMQAQPGAFNLITLELWSDIVVPSEFDVDRVHLAGCGAIGEAAVETMRVSHTRGELYAVDHETLDESNLQRYVLAFDGDIEAAKPALVSRALADTDLMVVEVPTRWGDDGRTAPGQDLVLSALDSADDRIAVQAGLHGRVYNAFTQPEDLGWTRHENFGSEPCLACLYWPTGPRPHHHQLVASALQQPELRVRAYLGAGWPAGRPLPRTIGFPVVSDPPSAAEIERWMHTPILHDIAAGFGMSTDELSAWEQKGIDELYREGVCGGAIMRLRSGVSARELAVPLAHQSALAGIMLAVQLLAASDDQLKLQRPRMIEGRYNVLRGVPTTIAIPTVRTPGCLCFDQDFVGAWKSSA